jgi:hypothetical protein
MPTRVGDMLSWAEGAPFERYGLDTVRCWPALWSLLPEERRADLTAARHAVDAAVAAMIWAVAFCLAAVWAWWALPMGALVLLGAYLVWLPRRVRAYADLIVAAFDVHRTALYQALRWPLPASPAEEHAAGLAVTDFLWAGSDRPDPRYTAGPPDA